jgi:hypothetical protein
LVSIDDTKLFNDKFQEWEDFCDFNSPHGGLDGQNPYGRLRQKTTTMPAFHTDKTKKRDPGLNRRPQLHT